jgi:RecG-like helicase
VVTLSFFHFNRAQQERLKPGAKLRCFGEVRRGKSGVRTLSSRVPISGYRQSHRLEETLTPIYPATEGITQSRIRDLCGQALRRLESSDCRDYPRRYYSGLEQQLSYSLVVPCACCTIRPREPHSICWPKASIRLSSDWLLKS